MRVLGKNKEDIQIVNRHIAKLIATLNKTIELPTSAEKAVVLEFWWLIEDLRNARQDM